MPERCLDAPGDKTKDGEMTNESKKAGGMVDSPHTLVWHDGPGQNFMRMPTEGTDFSVYEEMPGASIVPEAQARVAHRLLEKVLQLGYEGPDGDGWSRCRECRWIYPKHTKGCDQGELLEAAGLPVVSVDPNRNPLDQRVGGESDD